MVTATVRKSGNSLVLTIPPEIVREKNLRPGQMVGVEIQPVEVRTFTPEEAVLVDRILAEHGEAYQYLADK